MTRTSAVLLALAVAVPAGARATANPVQLTQEGRLTDSSDQLLTGQVTLGFKLYAAATGGDATWSDSFDLQVDGGLYAVTLGGTEGHPTLDAANFQSDVFLGISVNGQELSPRLPIGALPVAAYARQAGDAATVGGHPASDFLLLGAGGSLGSDVSAGTITATDGFEGDLHGNADTASVAATASAPADSFTLDGAKLTGHVDTSLLSGDIPAASVVGALTNATIDGTRITGQIDTAILNGNLAAASVTGALANATMDGSKLTGHVDTSLLSGNLAAASVTGALSNATIDGSKITGHVDTSLLSGNLAAASVTGALANATIGGQSVTGAVSDSSALGGRTPDDFASAFAQNVLPGGTFEEQGFYYWNIRSGSASNSTLPSIDTTTAHSGKASVKLFSGGTGSSLGSVLLPVPAGARVRVSGWAKGNVTTGSAAWHNLYLIGRWYKADGSSAGDGCEGPCPDLELVGSENVSSWRFRASTYTAPADAAYYRVNEVGLIADATGTAWIDDLRVEVEGGGDTAVEPAASGFKAVNSFGDWRNNAGSCGAGSWCPIPARTLVLVKHRPDTLLRVAYQDTLGTAGPNYGECNWAITVTPGTSPSAPGGANQVLVFSDADLTRYGGVTTWMMANATHTALAFGKPAGPVTVQVYSYRDGSASECLMGWNASGGYLSAEEIVSQP